MEQFVNSVEASLNVLEGNEVVCTSIERNGWKLHFILLVFNFTLFELSTFITIWSEILLP